MTREGERESEGKPYEKPVLKRLGTLSELTEAGIAAMPETIGGTHVRS